MSENDRIMCKNPNTGRDDVRIARALYEPVRDAILAALDERGEVAFKELTAEVRARTDPSLWASASPAWYTTTVKLDLEARELIERVAGARPQRLRRIPDASD